MGERIGNLRTKRRCRMGQLKWRLGISTAILLGLATIVTSTSATPSARIASTGKTLYGNGGVRVAWNFQGTRTSAAGPCTDKAKRYVDCGNGTVADTVTGLIWLKQSNCLSTANWEAAKKAVAGLKNGDCMLTDGSSPGDWRLPTQEEWKTTMEKARDLRCTGPILTNDEGTACISDGPSSFTGVEADYYWSVTTIETNGHAWFGDLDHGNLLNGNVINTLRVWPVRGVKR